MRADNASEKNAKNSMLIADADESVNMLSDPSLILLVNGTADEAADISKYAIICIAKYLHLRYLYRQFSTLLRIDKTFLGLSS